MPTLCNKCKQLQYYKSDVDQKHQHHHMKSPPPKLPPRLSVLGLIGTSSGIFLIAAILQLGIVLCICKRKNSSRRKDSLALACLNSEGFKVLSFSQINILTEDFKNQIGSNLFIGMLPNNKLITVKDLSASIEELVSNGHKQSTEPEAVTTQIPPRPQIAKTLHWFSTACQTDLHNCEASIHEYNRRFPLTSSLRNRHFTELL
ncbi:hypothetical protein Lal_00032173 [Lupinus albus]|nr:hypothetical protein Lal_00032173 [Lupinus albus]